MKRAEMIAEVARITRDLMRDDSPASFAALDFMPECIGWLSNFTDATAKDIRAGVLALATVADIESVRCLYGQAKIEEKKLTERKKRRQ